MQPKPLAADHADALMIMACGQPIPYSQARIADDADQPSDEVRESGGPRSLDDVRS